MKYVAFLGVGILAAATILVLIFKTDDSAAVHSHTNKEMQTLVAAGQDTMPEGEFPYQKTEAEWKEILTSKEYRILRERGTEFPYVNKYNDNKKKGTYVCAACGQKLYSSDHKYDSGTGWPSFWKPINDSLVAEREDNSLFMTRTEIVCSNCGSHLGHVFNDGPEPTGLRYCMNSAAMNFIEKKDMPSNE